MRTLALALQGLTMKRFCTLLLLVAATALAQGANPRGGMISRGNFLRVPTYSTPGNTGSTGINYYVDPTGSDGNPCTTSGTGACLTIQGALNKVPKLLRDLVTINVAAGSYAGFTVSGFTADTGANPDGANGIYVLGTLATSTLTTGSATGTATSGTAGSTSTFGTLTDTNATWTVNDLRGRFITTATPTNAAFVISANTATTITIEGVWSQPTGSTTYTIQDPATIITTPVSIPGTGISGSPATNRAAIELADNTVGFRQNSMLIANLRIATSAGQGVDVTDWSSAWRFINLQVRPTGAAVAALVINGVAGASQSFVVADKCDFSTASSGAVVSAAAGQLSIQNTLIRNSGSSSFGVLISNGLGPTASFSLTASELLGLGQSSGGAITVLAGGMSTGLISNSRISCAAATGVGFQLTGLSAASTTVSKPATASPITAIDISTCGTAVQVTGSGSNVDIVSMTGSAGTAALTAQLGGLIVFTKTGTTITAGTDEINLDSGAVTAAFTDVAASSCLSNSVTGSRVCGR